MLTKEQFIDYMEQIKREDMLYDQMEHTLSDNGRDITNLHPCTYNLSIQLLEDLMNDTEQKIASYIYNSYWGQNDEGRVVETLEQLYDALCNKTNNN